MVFVREIRTLDRSRIGDGDLPGLNLPSCATMKPWPAFEQFYETWSASGGRLGCFDSHV